MAKFIELSLNGEKYDKRFLEIYLDKAREDVKKGVKKTADEMAKVAQKTYRRAEYDGNNDVQVSVKQTIGKEKTICAYKVEAYSHSGNVAFIEFGAGANATNALTKEHPLRATAKPPLKKLGEWGNGNGKADYWVFRQVGAIQKPTWNLFPVWTKSGGGHYREGVWWTAGNKPARAMWRAHLYFEKHIKDNIRKGGK